MRKTMTRLATAAFVAVGLVRTVPEGAAQERRTRNVILVTADGLRPEELFGGMDRRLVDAEAGGVETPEHFRERFDGTRKERREKLFPFFWTRLAPRGVVLGDRERGSTMTVTNPYRISYPGYAELLTGRPQPAIVDNRAVRIPSPTILEIVREELGLPRTAVAVFASWERFEHIAARREGAVVVNAGYRPADAAWATPGMEPWSSLQMDLLTPWDTARHDGVTIALAVDYLRAHRPRLLYVALDETDDWAHDGRYDRVLHGARLLDEALRRLWTAAQAIDGYRDRTSLVVTTDHGRGETLEDWTSHGADVAGSEAIWLAVVGPDTPARGVVAPAPLFHQAQIAATILRLLGIDPSRLGPEAAGPIELVFR